jgi:hypothetical protein
MERDMEAKPYSPDEMRVAQWLSKKGVGGGDDPIGFLMVSYDWLIEERKSAMAQAWPRDPE